MAKRSYPWVVAGGKVGEMGHCERCGVGLQTVFPLPLYLAVAMMSAFTKQHSKCRPGSFREPEPNNAVEWFAGRDTGTSSRSIYFAMTGLKHDRHDIPHDPADFGRCYRLLQLMPEWKKDMQKVAARFKEWQPFVNAWDELTQLYEEELPQKTAPKLYARIQELRDAA